MPKKSAGVLLYRDGARGLEVFLVHPGGPFWAKKDDGVWSIPKGEFAEGEDGLEAAKREFEEETGFLVDGAFEEMEPVRQPGGKVVHAWCVEGNIDSAAIRSNNFSMEWPPRSGKMREFPEVDRGAWFELRAACTKILKGQLALLEQLQHKIQSGRQTNPDLPKTSKRS